MLLLLPLPLLLILYILSLPSPALVLFPSDLTEQYSTAKTVHTVERQDGHVLLAVGTVLDILGSIIQNNDYSGNSGEGRGRAALSLSLSLLQS